jgi:hypothetical protein
MGTVRPIAGITLGNPGQDNDSHGICSDTEGITPDSIRATGEPAENGVDYYQYYRPEYHRRDIGKPVQPAEQADIGGVYLRYKMLQRYSILA